MAKQTKRSNAHEPVRKLGERTETIEVKLSPAQIEDERARVIDLLQERDELDEEWKNIKAAHKAKIADLDSKLAAARGAVSSGKVRREITIEEWVTRQNEVIRIHKETREELGRRNATAAELQEDLPLGDHGAADAASDEHAGDDFGETEH